jgi:hypothetical protein
MKNMNRLLQPGGYLVVGLVDEAAQSISDPKGGSLWRQTAFNGNFSCVELHSDATDGHDSFVLEAQKASWAAFPWNSVNATDTPLVIDFALDHVLQYQQAVRECDSASLWINATSGIDDAAALGFSRSLRREMHSTKVYLVLFDPIWTPKTRLSIIGDLAGNPDVEVETLIDTCGHAQVPRLIRCTSKLIARELNFEQYWSLKSGALSVEPLPPVSDGHVLVRITHLAFTIDGLQGFVGRSITNPGSTAWAREDFVVGVVDSDRISNHFLVHEGQIAAAPDSATRNVYAACAVPLLLFAISVDPESMRTPARLRGRKFLVINANEPMGRWLTTILLGLGVTFETSIAQPTEISLKAIHQSDFIFCGYSSQKDIQVIQSAMNPDALIVCWTGSAVGRVIRRNPWMVGDALASFNHLNIQPPVDFEVMCGSPEEHLARKCPSHVDIQTPLFHSEKSYLLIGGIGSLGLGIAWWMYQVSFLGHFAQSLG